VGNREATLRTYELFAHEVLPAFDSAMPSRVKSYDLHTRNRAGTKAEVVHGWELASY